MHGAIATCNNAPFEPNLHVFLTGRPTQSPLGVSRRKERIARGLLQFKTDTTCTTTFLCRCKVDVVTMSRYKHNARRMTAMSGSVIMHVLTKLCTLHTSVNQSQNRCSSLSTLLLDFVLPHGVWEY